MRKPSAVQVLATLLVLSWISFLSTGPRAAEDALPVQHQKWQYRSGRIDGLDKLGLAGWEAYAVVTNANGIREYELKRRVN